MAKYELHNNGMPEGIDYRTIKSGDMLVVSWTHEEPSVVLVLENRDLKRPHNYKREVEFMVFDPRRLGREVFYVDSSQIIKVIKSNSLELQLLHAEQDLTTDELSVRFHL